MQRSLKPVARSLKPSRSSLAIVAICALASTLLSGCVTAFVAIGVTAVGIGAAALAYECDEPVSVSIWDPGTAHVVCDAVVTATSGNDTVELSPCYTTLLGAGTWTVTAVKQGRPIATGIITVERDHRCNEPIHHTLELTLAAPSPAAPKEPTMTAAPNAPAPTAPPEPPASPTATATVPPPAAATVPPAATAPPAPSAR
jgi:hypothetical protein